jgi:hypothetical protein
VEKGEKLIKSNAGATRRFPFQNAKNAVCRPPITKRRSLLPTGYAESYPTRSKAFFHDSEAGFPRDVLKEHKPYTTFTDIVSVSSAQ